MYKRVERKWPLYITWIVAFLGVGIITLLFEVESTSFQGIAETREIVVNSEGFVEIKRVHVVEGQAIQKGQLLVELGSPEMMLKINEISHQLEQIKAEKGVNKIELRSKIDQLKAEKLAKVSEINQQIIQLQSQYEMNKKLASCLKSISSSEKAQGSLTGSPILLKIEGLKRELELCVNPIDIKIELFQKALDASACPIEIQVEQLENELELLNQENRKLNIYAQISGIIGSVNFKAGEKVAPFIPILTLHTKTPSFIKGYIYENVYTKVAEGKKVSIISLTDSKSQVTGSIVGVGARIVEYPVRLRKHPELQLWGREVVIKIPETNPFILGEKVAIQMEDQKNDVFFIVKKFFSKNDRYLTQAL